MAFLVFVLFLLLKIGGHDGVVRDPFGGCGRHQPGGGAQHLWRSARRHHGRRLRGARRPRVHHARHHLPGLWRGLKRVRSPVPLDEPIRCYCGKSAGELLRGKRGGGEYHTGSKHSPRMSLGKAPMGASKGRRLWSSSAQWQTLMRPTCRNSLRTSRRPSRCAS